MMNCSWTFVHEPARLTFYELLVNCSWTIYGFIISSWTVHELMMNCMNVYLFNQQCELFRNCWWIIHELFLFHNKFLNSSWTVMVNCSWTLVHEPTMWAFHELFMNCSWTFMNVHEQFIKSFIIWPETIVILYINITGVWGTFLEKKILWHFSDHQK